MTLPLAAVSRTIAGEIPGAAERPPRQSVSLGDAPTLLQHAQPPLAPVLPATSREARDPALITGLQAPERGPRGVRLAASGWDNVTADDLPQLRDWFTKTEEFVSGVPPSAPVRQAPSIAGVVPAGSADRDRLVARLAAAGFRPEGAIGVSAPTIATPPAVQRWRIDDATRLGYPGPLNIFVPATFSSAAPAHVHLHGYMLRNAGNVETQVFGRRDQHSFFEMLRASGTQGLAILPESTGNNTQFNAAWGTPGGPQRFDTLMTNLAGLAGRQQFSSATLSTHSGSGLLGDQLVLGSRFGREVVRFRGHFDDGFGTNDWRTRYQADVALEQRGGTVLSLARTPQHSDHIGEGSNHMNAAAWYERTGQQPVFVQTPYRNRNGTGGIDTFVREDMRLPTRPMSDFLGDELPPRITRFNVTSRNHWEPINAWTTLLRMSNPAPTAR